MNGRGDVGRLGAHLDRKRGLGDEIPDMRIAVAVVFF